MCVNIKTEYQLLHISIHCSIHFNISQYHNCIAEAVPNPPHWLWLPKNLI